jgi:hypothetical protein
MSSEDEDILIFAKPSKAAPTIDKALLLDVSLLRRTAFDLQDVHLYGLSIWTYCSFRSSWSKSYIGEGPTDLEIPTSPTFLEKLALPSKLFAA